MPIETSNGELHIQHNCIIDSNNWLISISITSHFEQYDVQALRLSLATNIW